VKILSLLVLLLAFSLATFGQAPTGILKGVITDESGALVPGAKVTISNATGPVQSVVAGNDGSYAITGLPAGKYTVLVTSPGLNQFQPAAVDIGSGATTFSIQLRVALEKQEVTVQENAGPSVSVDPSSNAGALVLRGADLEALSDDPDDLQADLQALAGPAAGPNGGQIYIDGFTGGTLPNKDSIREIRINSNPFSPEYDRLGFGRIEIFTKPGTDKFRGNVNANFGNDIFNSRNPYAAEKAPLNLRDFGGSLSGPLGKKASFFIDATDRNVNNGNIINAVILDPSFVITPFNTVFEAPQDRLRISPRFDYQLNGSNTMMIRYGFTRNTVDESGVGNLSLLDRGTRNVTTDHTVQATETAILSTKVINETRFQLFHAENDRTANNSTPTITVQGSFNGGGAQVGHSTDTSNRYELQNYTSIASGAHSWKFGVRLRAATISDVSPMNFGGSYTFAGGYGPVLDANFLPIVPGLVCDPANPNPNCQNLTSIQRYQRTLVLQQKGLSAAQIRLLGGGATQFNISAGNPAADVTQIDTGVFVGDDWRVKPNFTLSLGLRYETQTNMHDWTDFAPRIGFAWAPSQKKNGPRPKTVIRGGFGMFYDRLAETSILNAERFNGITEQTYVVTNPDTFPNIPTVAQISQFNKTQLNEIDPTFRAPYIIQSAIGVERQLPHNTTVAVNYTNSHGVHELRSRDLNAPLQGVLPFPGFGFISSLESTGIYNQNQIITNVNTRVSAKISLNGYYSYSRAFSDSDGGYPANPFDYTGEYARANNDVRNRGFIGGSIATRWDLRLSPFITMASGAPYNITTGKDLFGDTLFNSRPGIATDPTRSGVVSTPYGLLDPNPIGTGEKIIPRNFGQGPGNFSINLRVSKTFGFGPTREGRANPAGADGGGGDAGGPGGGRPPGGGGRGPGGPGGGGGPRGGGGGFAGMGGRGGGGGGGATNRRYNLTLSVQARNLFNHVNPGQVTGNITSPLFGQSNSLAGGFGAFAENGNNRRLDFQMRFTF
jgi:hypothetical protein